MNVRSRDRALLPDQLIEPLAGDDASAVRRDVGAGIRCPAPARRASPGIAPAFQLAEPSTRWRSRAWKRKAIFAPGASDRALCRPSSHAPASAHWLSWSGAARIGLGLVVRRARRARRNGRRARSRYRFRATRYRWAPRRPRRPLAPAAGHLRVLRARGQPRPAAAGSPAQTCVIALAEMVVANAALAHRRSNGRASNCS